MIFHITMMYGVFILQHKQACEACWQMDCNCLAGKKPFCQDEFAGVSGMVRAFFVLGR